MVTVNNLVYAAPPVKERERVMWLLTIMGVMVKGHWEGRYGEFFIGYSLDEAQPVKTS